VALFRIVQTALLAAVASPDAFPGAAARVALSLADGAMMGVAALGVLWLAERLPIERPHRARNVALHLAFGLAGMAANLFVLRALGARIAGRPGRVHGDFATFFIQSLAPSLLLYVVLVASMHAVLYFRRDQARAVRAARLEAALAHARLAALAAQLRPHFLFNTLNLVSELIHLDPAAADETVVRLARLLRVTLDTSDAHEVPLGQELEVLASYLEIQRARFGDRLRVEWRVDVDALDALVPPLLLQPLVENAFVHGLAPRSAGGVVRVGAAVRRRGGECVLSLRVEDDGVGPPVGRALVEGVGLRNTRRRLATLYGARHRLRVGRRKGGGTLALIRIPVRRAD
jgi:two-component sensor histidine kinase